MNTRTPQLDMTRGRCLMTLDLAAIRGGLTGEPAVAEERHDERYGHPRPEHGYAPRRRLVYAPPPVYYAPPPPSPGISLFFPIHIR
jgi:hypothetical protein